MLGLSTGTSLYSASWSSAVPGLVLGCRTTVQDPRALALRVGPGGPRKKPVSHVIGPCTFTGHFFKSSSNSDYIPFPIMASASRLVARRFTTLASCRCAEPIPICSIGRRNFRSSASRRTDGVFRELTEQRVRKPWIEALRNKQNDGKDPTKPSSEEKTPNDRQLEPKRMSDSYHSVVRRITPVDEIDIDFSHNRPCRSPKTPGC